MKIQTYNFIKLSDFMKVSCGLRHAFHTKKSYWSEFTITPFSLTNYCPITPKLKIKILQNDIFMNFTPKKFRWFCK